jgi:tetratricopeptide (TPR) repeat protein
MRISLESVRARSFFAIAVLVISIGFGFLAAKVWLAKYWNRSSNPKNWLRAAKLEPGNAEYWRKLGVASELSMQDPSGRTAITDLRRAAKLDPRSADIWADLANAYEKVGNPAEARKAYEKAQADYPISSDIAWRYGSFLLRQGDLAGGFGQIRRALAVDPSLTTSGVAECWEASRNADTVLKDALPHETSYYLAAQDYFLSQKQDDAALVAWNGLLNLQQQLKVQDATPLVNQLIDDHRIPEARKTWQEALDATHWPHQQSDSGSAVFNGGFEYPVANGGFGWREEPVSGVTYDLDRGVAHSGKQSLRVTFDGSTNLDFAQLLQFVPVKPNQRYQFIAFIRTENISTDSGVRFLIYDPNHASAPRTLTPNIIGTNAWTEVATDVSTGAHTDLLIIALRRIPSEKFDNKLAGTVWIDNVSLVPVEEETSTTPRP